MSPSGKHLCIDFLENKSDYKRPLPKGKQELIAKAVGLNKGLRKVLDTTAGLAQDAIVFARLGAKVTAIERSEVVFRLLKDAHDRALALAPDVEYFKNLKFINSDSIEFLKSISQEDCPEVIYIDPMYPEKKKSALPRLEMQIFKEVIGPDEDSIELLRAALQSRAQRIVVKRPRTADPLIEKPIHSFEGKSVRYDIYTPKAST